jgi:hypothetical protein
LYERYVPIREIYHFGQQFLNGFTPQRMRAVRGYFDQVFEGQYAKSIPEQQRALLVQIADAKYTQETGRQVNREDPLWKTYRNVEASRRYPDLWHQFRDDISASEGMSVHPTMTNANDPDLGSNALGRQGQGAAPNHDLTKPETFPTGTGQQKQRSVGGGFDNSVNPELVKPQEGFPTNQHVDGVTTVFASQSIPWKPSMTEVEAEAYTSESYYKDRVFYHGTNQNGANNIANNGINPQKFYELSTYSPGFYLGNDQTIARNYAKRK